MRHAVLVLVLLSGVALGYSGAIFISLPPEIVPAPTPAPGPVAVGNELRRTAPSDTTASSVNNTERSPAPDRITTYLVWSTGGLTDGLIDGLPGLFEATSVVIGDVVELEVAHGVIPLDALAIDPEAHRPFDPTGSLAQLRPGTVVLGESSAMLRSAAIGDEMRLSGSNFRVVGIAPDDVVSAAEVVFAASDPALPVATPRFALIATKVDRTEFEAAVRSLYDGPASLRIRAEGESPWLRHGDAVLPQVFIKQALGEFSYTARRGAEFVQDSEFQDEWITTTVVPIVGEVVCHQIVAEMLTGAMTQLVDEGLAHLVDPTGFAGCWSPRFIRSSDGSPSGVSRHAWGGAVDLNAPTNPIGSAGTQDPRLVEVMLDWGFTWGGDWLVPDAMHFEFGG